MIHQINQLTSNYLPSLLIQQLTN